MASSVLETFGNLLTVLLLMALFGLVGSMFGLIGLFIGVAIGIILGLGSIQHGESSERDRQPPMEDPEGGNEAA